MPVYTLTVEHRSLQSARTVTLDGELRSAKVSARKQFSGIPPDWKIVIRDASGVVVAWRIGRDGQWMPRQKRKR